MWVLVAAALAAAADLGPLLRSCLPPDAVGGVAESLAALGAEAPADLRRVTGGELAGLGPKAVQAAVIVAACARSASMQPLGECGPWGWTDRSTTSYFCTGDIRWLRWGEYRISGVG